MSLSEPALGPVTFEYRSRSGTADEDDNTGDFDTTVGTVTIAAGETVASIAVDVSPDTTSEAAEEFHLVLTTTSAEIEGGRTGSIGTAIILDDDSGFGFFPEISIRNAEVLEGTFGVDNFMAFTVSLSAPYSNPVSIAFEALSGTAIVASDPDVANDTLVIPAGETTGHIIVRTVIDGDVEEDEKVILELSNPTNGVFSDGAATLQATGTILDDDTPAPAAGTPRLIV